MRISDTVPIVSCADAHRGVQASTAELFRSDATQTRRIVTWMTLSEVVNPVPIESHPHQISSIPDRDTRAHPLITGELLDHELSQILTVHDLLQPCAVYRRPHLSP
jgi:hypothetical protein